MQGASSLEEDFRRDSLGSLGLMPDHLLNLCLLQVG